MSIEEILIELRHEKLSPARRRKISAEIGRREHQLLCAQQPNHAIQMYGPLLDRIEHYVIDENADHLLHFLSATSPITAAWAVLRVFDRLGRKGEHASQRYLACLLEGLTRESLRQTLVPMHEITVGAEQSACTMFETIYEVTHESRLGLPGEIDLTFAEKRPDA